MTGVTECTNEVMTPNVYNKVLIVKGAHAVKGARIVQICRCPIENEIKRLMLIIHMLCDFLYGSIAELADSIRYLSQCFCMGRQLKRETDRSSSQI